MARRAAIIVLAASLLAGCAAEGDAELTQYTLAETKSPVQLVRNDAASRVPGAIVEESTEVRDASVACYPKANDPQGLVRAWNSIVELDVAAGAVGGVSEVVAALVADLEALDWRAAEVSVDGSETATRLTRENSIVELQISVADGTTTIRLDSTGPCVKTAGAGSDEVTALEG